MRPRSSDMVEHYTLNHIWLDRAGTLVKSEEKFQQLHAGFASDCPTKLALSNTNEES
jgi:hypothetical protein